MRKTSNVVKLNCPYREVIGALMFLVIVMRSDIAFAVNLLSKFISNFDENHVRAVKMVFGYLSGTVNLGIKYKTAVAGLF